MYIAIRATCYMIVLNSMVALFGLTSGLMMGVAQHIEIAALALASVLFLLLVRKGLRQEYCCVVLLFSAYCLADVGYALSAGFVPTNLLRLADAGLSVTALSGMILWRGQTWREARLAAS